MKSPITDLYARNLGGLTILFGLHIYDAGFVPMMAIGILLSLSGIVQVASVQSLSSIVASVLLVTLLVGARPSTMTFAFLLAHLIVVFDLAKQRFALRSILFACYLFAGLNKLISPAWKSGEILEINSEILMNYNLIGVTVWATIIGEISLGILCLFRLRIVLIPAALLHLGILLTVSISPRIFFAHTVYSAVLLLLLWFGTRPHASPETLPIGSSAVRA